MQTQNSSNNKISIALVGAGDRGLSIINELLQYINFVDSVFVYDDVYEVAVQGSQQFKPQGYKSVCCKSYDEILNNTNVTWVFIASKNYLHKDHAVRALSAQKHGEAVQKSNRLFVIGLVLRYTKFYQKVKQLIDGDAIGKIISIEASETLTPSHGGYIFRNWRRFKEQAGPHISEKCCHDIDIVNWLVNSQAKSVAAFGGLDIFKKENKVEMLKLIKESPGSERLFDQWSSYSYEIDPFLSDKSIEDNLVCILEYRNGVKVNFHTNCCTALPKRTLYICGLKGTIKGDLLKGKLKYKKLTDDKPTVIQFKDQNMHGGGDEQMITEIIGLMDKTRKTDFNQQKTNFKDVQLFTTVDHCFVSTVTCLAIDEARIKNQVIDLEPIWKKFNI